MYACYALYPSPALGLPLSFLLFCWHWCTFKLIWNTITYRHCLQGKPYLTSSLPLPKPVPRQRMPIPCRTKSLQNKFVMFLEMHCHRVRADFWEGDEDSNFSVFRVRRFTEWPRPLHRIAFPVEKALPNPSFTDLPPPFFLGTLLPLKSSGTAPVISIDSLDFNFVSVI